MPTVYVDGAFCVLSESQKEYYLLGGRVPRGVLVEANLAWPDLFTPKGVLAEKGEAERCQILRLAQPLLPAIYTWRTKNAGTIDYDDRVIAHDYVHAVLGVGTTHEEEDFVAEIQEFWGIETVADALAWRELDHPGKEQ